MKINHTKAQEIYEEVDPLKGSLDLRTIDIQNAPGNYTLEGLIRSYANTYRRYDNIDQVIQLLEGLYEALQNNTETLNNLSANPNHKDLESLFELAIKEFKDVASYYHNNELISYLDEVYCLGEGGSE